MKNSILQKLQEGKNILIIGKENTGKSHFAINELLPLFQENNLKVTYFKNCDDLDSKEEYDFFIVDEVELLFDKDFLELKYPEAKPYYPDLYLTKVKAWHEKLAQIQKPTIVIVTRNTDPEIDNLIKNYKNLEWNGTPVEVIKFVKKS